MSARGTPGGRKLDLIFTDEELELLSDDVIRQRLKEVIAGADPTTAEVFVSVSAEEWIRLIPKRRHAEPCGGAAMSPQQKASKAYHLLRALYAKRAPAPILRRAERLVHIHSIRAFIANRREA